MKEKFEKKEMTIVAVEKTGFQGFPMMFHPHIEILFALEGNIRVTVDAKERVLQPGEFCVVFPYVLHSYEDAPNARFRLIMAAPQYLSGFEDILLAAKAADSFYALDPVLELLSKNTVTSMAEEDPLGEKIAYGYATALVGEILKRTTLTKTNSAENTALKRLVIYCNNNYTQKISVRSAAAACFISESFVSKLFSKEIGCSFSNYISALRVSHAKRMLQKTDKSITDIMYACGFQNQSSFNRVFFEQCGQTPRQFRRSVSEK